MSIKLLFNLIAACIESKEKYGLYFSVSSAKEHM